MLTTLPFSVGRLTRAQLIFNKHVVNWLEKSLSKTFEIMISRCTELSFYLQRMSSFFINGAYFSFIDEAMTFVQMKTSYMKLIYVQPSSKSMILPFRDDLSDNIGHTVWCKTLRLCFVLYRRSKKFWIEMCRNLTTLFSLYINRSGILSFFFLQCLPLHILRLYIVWRTCNSEFM